MKFHELSEQIKPYFYTEDQGLLYTSLATTISARKKLGDPVWLVIVGPSSSGKSQVLRPIALTDNKFIHRIDDVTENTFLSGSQEKKGDDSKSFLKRIGSRGLLVISDLTVIFSKSGDTKTAVLGAMRMIHDGEMKKMSGSSSKAIEWEGSLGLLAGCTTVIYQFTEELAIMGERFIYWRMKKYDDQKATRVALRRKLFGREVDTKLSDIYGEYIKDVVKYTNGIDIPENVLEAIEDRVVTISTFAATLRTPIQYDKYVRAVTHIPVSEASARVALEIMNIAKAMMCMCYFESDGASWDLGDDQIHYLEWCAYSLANEEKRACLAIIGSVEYMTEVPTTTIADMIGLNTSIVELTLQNLAAIGMLVRSGSSDGFKWRFKDHETWEIIRRLENVVESKKLQATREMTASEAVMDDDAIRKAFREF